MIRVCCDSNAQLDPALAARHGIEVVPLTVTLDGVAHLEGVELDADGFWAAFDDGRVPEVSTAAPSPGQFVEAYEHLVAGGATEIVSVHMGSDMSATFDAARLASQQVEVPFELVDTGAASFVVGIARSEHVADPSASVDHDVAAELQRVLGGAVEAAAGPQEAAIHQCRRAHGLRRRRHALSRVPLRTSRFDTAPIPWVTFTSPEVARIGMTEREAADHGGRVAYLPLTDVDRGMITGETAGFVKLIAGPRRLLGNAGGGRLLGATIVAPAAGEMIGSIALAMRTNMFTGRLAQTTQAYPTWSMAVQEAAAQFFMVRGDLTARDARHDS